MVQFVILSGDILKKYPRAASFDKVVLFQCFRRIKPYLNLEDLCEYLMEYNVITNTEDRELLTSSYRLVPEKMTSLIKLLERAGAYGFAACYASLKESSEQDRGHAEVVYIIDQHGTVCKLLLISTFHLVCSSHS